MGSIFWTLLALGFMVELTGSDPLDGSVWYKYSFHRRSGHQSLVYEPQKKKGVPYLQPRPAIFQFHAIDEQFDFPFFNEDTTI